MSAISLQKRIPLDKVLTEMEKTDLFGNYLPFSGEVVLFDINRKTGGEKMAWESAVLCAPPGGKKAYHHRNDTRNIKLLPSNEVRTIQPILMTTFNGQKVYL